MGNILKNRFANYLEPKAIEKRGFYPFFRSFESRQGTSTIVRGKEVLMFGSNSYLGLTTHPQVVEAAEKALETYGPSCAGSRFLNGTTQLHEALEERLARFLNKEAALIFSTGFQVNLGVIPTIAGRGDAILLDRNNHASIFEGARLSYAQSYKYNHSDLDALERKLLATEDHDLRLIVTDGVFSMEGDIAKLPQITQLAQQYDAVVMCDCAHAVGVLGDHGRGTPNHFGLNDEVELIGGTFSKSLASLGGFIAGDADTIYYLKHRSRSLIFSASMTPSSVAAALAALDLIEKDDSMRLKLWENTHYALSRLNSLGFDTGNSATPIIPIYIRDNDMAYDFTARLFDYGVFVNPVVAPAVAPSESLIRFSLMATHSIDQIETAIDLMCKVAGEVGLKLNPKAA
jgi:8-amino-7-oxononanoate synthase